MIMCFIKDGKGSVGKVNLAVAVENALDSKIDSVDYKGN